MATFRVIQATDMHLSRARAYTQAGWEVCLQHINAASPDLVVLTGDHVLDDPDNEDDQVFAIEQMARIAAPHLTVPGNHDIGDAGPAPYMGQAATSERLAAWVRHNGPDYWTHELGAWLIVGLNGILPGSDLAEAEKAQLDWLASVMSANPGRPLGVFIHKPICLDRHGEAMDSEYLVGRPGRAALVAILQSGNLRFVGSGHAHHYRMAAVDGVAHVWAPSATLLGTPTSLTSAFDPAAGLIDYILDESDGGSVRFERIAPKGLCAFDSTPLRKAHGPMRFAPPCPA